MSVLPNFTRGKNLNLDISDEEVRRLRQLRDKLSEGDKQVADMILSQADDTSTLHLMQPGPETGYKLSPAGADPGEESFSKRALESGQQGGAGDYFEQELHKHIQGKLPPQLNPDSLSSFSSSAEISVDESADIKLGTSGSKTLVEESIAVLKNDIFSIEQAIKNQSNVVGSSENEIRLTSNWKKGIDKGFDDAEAIRIARKTLGFNRGAASRNVDVPNATQLLKHLKKELLKQELFLSTSNFQDDSHVKEFEKIETKKIDIESMPDTFKSYDEFNEYKKIVKEFDKYTPDKGEVLLTKSLERLDGKGKNEGTSTKILSQDKVGFVDGVNPTAATSGPGPYDDPNAPPRQQGFINEVHLSSVQKNMETKASINYEKTFGPDVVPANMMMNITDTKHKNYGKSYEQVMNELGTEGKNVIKATDNPAIVKFAGVKVGPSILSFDSYQSGESLAGWRVNSSGTDTESYDPKTRTTKPKTVVPGIEHKMTDLSEFRYTDAETNKFKETPDKILMNTPEFKAQHDELKNMFPNTQHPENLVKLTLRNMNEGIRMTPNKGLINILKALP